MTRGCVGSIEGTITIKTPRYKGIKINKLTGESNMEASFSKYVSFVYEMVVNVDKI